MNVEGFLPSDLNSTGDCPGFLHVIACSHVLLRSRDKAQFLPLILACPATKAGSITKFPRLVLCAVASDAKVPMIATEATIRTHALQSLGRCQELKGTEEKLLVLDLRVDLLADCKSRLVLEIRTRSMQNHP